MYKRFEMRRSIQLPVELITSHWDDPIHLIASDLTPGGAYIRSEIIPDAGDKIVCSFELLRGRPEYCFFGEITRVNLLRRTTDSGPPGFAIKFTDASPYDRLNIRRSLHGLPPPVPAPPRTSHIIYDYS